MHCALLCRSLILTLFVVLAGAGRSAQAQDGDLLKYLPRSANALVVIDAESLLQSELAISQGWTDKQAMTYGQRPLVIPPEAKRVAVAAQLDSSNNLEQTWKLAVVQLKEPFPLNAIARREGGYIDQIADTAAVWTPSNTYFVGLTEDVIGMMFPANRQVLSRWTKFAQRNPLVELPDYLYRASAGVSAESQIVMALDLADVVQPHRVNEELSDSEVLAGDAAKIEAVGKVLSTIEGATLTIQVSDIAEGSIRIDFGSDVAPLGNLAKPLLLEFLDHLNAHVPDFESWSAELLGQTLVVSGKFSESGLRRVSSLVEVPTTKFSDLKDAEPAESGTDTYTQASQTYFHSVTALIDDLRQETTGSGKGHGLWFERYGRKIDGLPILNVDPELLDWGGVVASTFREMSIVDRSANVRAGTRKSQAYNRYTYGSGYGYYATRTTGPTESQKTAISRQEREGAQVSRFNNWKEVEDSTAAIRRRMTEKYGVEF